MVEWEVLVIITKKEKIDCEQVLHNYLAKIADITGFQLVWIGWSGICQNIDMFNSLDVMS